LEIVVGRSRRGHGFFKERDESKEFAVENDGVETIEWTHGEITFYSQFWVSTSTRGGEEMSITGAESSGEDDGSGSDESEPPKVVKLSLTINNNNLTETQNMAEQKKINISGNVGAIGDGNRVQGNDFRLVQANSPRLTNELERLLEQMKGARDATAHENEIALIADAHSSAKSGNVQKAMEYLKQVGQWTVEFARDVGVELVSDLIKTSSGSNC
jgi:hypothetical protein